MVRCSTNRKKKKETEKTPLDIRVMSKAGKGYVSWGWY